MPTFLTTSGLLATRSHATITSSPVEVVALGDAIAIAVLTPYGAPLDSVRFSIIEPPSPSLIVVVQEPKTVSPVVIHKIVKKP